MIFFLFGLESLVYLDALLLQVIDVLHPGRPNVSKVNPNSMTDVYTYTKKKKKRNVPDC